MVRLEMINVLLAGAGVLVAFGAINRMNGVTELCIKIAFVTIAVGLLGQAVSYALPDQWQSICDTLLYGGVLALLTGTRKATIWLPPAWMPKISIAVAAVAWAAFFLHMEV